MTKYTRGSQGEADAQLLHNAKAFGGTMGRELLDLIKRRDAEIEKMLALLRRWVKMFKNLPDVNYGMWLRDSAKAKDHHELFSLLTETKTQLKEAKEVKDE